MTEQTKCLICGRGRDCHDGALGLLTCRGIAVSTYTPATLTPAQPEADGLADVGAAVFDRLTRIAESVREPGSDRNLMMKPRDAQAILAALRAGGLRGAADEPAELRKVASALVAKLDLCQPHINGAFMMSFTRMGIEYSGPRFGEEMKALRRALAQEVL